MTSYGLRLKQARAERQIALQASTDRNQLTREGCEILSEKRVTLLAPGERRKDAEAARVCLRLRLCRGGGRCRSETTESEQTGYQEDPETGHIPTSLCGNP